MKNKKTKSNFFTSSDKEKELMGILRKILLIINKLSSRNLARPALLIRLAIALIVFIALVVAAKIWNAGQPIRTISVSGGKLINSDEIRSAINDSLLINVPKNAINLEELKKKINEHPFVAESFIKEGVHSLNIEIRERYPIAIVTDEFGDTHYADKDGVVLPYRLFREFSNLPIISGVYYNGKLDSFAIRGAINAINEMKTEENLFLFNSISEIKYNPNTKGYEMFDNDFGTKIYLGTSDNVSEKLENLNKFFHYNATSGLHKPIAYIDARWKGEIVVKYQV